MAASRANYPDFMLVRLAILEASLFNRDQQWPSSVPQYYQMMSTNEPFINLSGMSTLSTFAERDEGTPVSLDQLKQLFDKKFTPQGYALGLQFTREVIDDDRFGHFNQAGSLLADSSNYSKNVLAADMAEQGDTGTAAIYLSADGENIFDAAHPIDDGASTDSNLLSAADLNITSIQAMSTAHERVVNDRGLLMINTPELLVVPQEKRWRAAQLVKSLDDPETANRAITPFVDDALSYAVWRYLTDTDAFYMRGSYARQTIGWIWLTRQSLDLDQDVDIRVQTMLIVATERFTYGCHDWRGWVKIPAS